MIARTTLVLTLLAGTCVGAEKLTVRVDPRVELLAIVFRLAGHPEYNMPNSKSAYSDAVEAHFGGFRDHPTVVLARQLRSARGISYDAVMSLAVHLADDAWDPSPRTALNPRPPLLESRWREQDAAAFIESLGAFCRDSNFKGFVDQNSDRYAKSAEKLSEIVNRRDYIGWFDRFFGARPKATFVVIVGLLNGGGNYGVSMRHHDGREEISPVIGIYKWDVDGLPAIGDEIVPTIVHEFCHAYTNALVDKHLDALADAGEKLFAANAAVMKRQAYGSGRTVLYESMVRACVAYYMGQVDGAEAGVRQLKYEVTRGFKWTPQLLAAIKEYDQQRERYNSLDDFMPRVVEVFNSAAAKVESSRAAAPAVVSIVPANGTQDVKAAATRSVVITFDRKMRDKSWSLVGGGERYPRFGEPKFDAACKVLTVPVTLEPGKQYEFGLNSDRFQGFQSADGEPLQPLRVTFATAP